VNGENVLESGKKLRLNQICNKNRKALVGAFDHALALGPIAGTIDPAAQIRRIAECVVDAILVNFGSLRLAADALDVERPPAVIVRLDWTSVWRRAMCVAE
jgi:DhnA family fructose-bisphosphate aldolase class Ia